MIRRGGITQGGREMEQGLFLLDHHVRDAKDLGSEEEIVQETLRNFELFQTTWRALVKE